MKWTAPLAFIATVPAANWLVQHVGTVCAPNGPCLVPVGFGLSAPSGVLMVGLAFTLRDLTQRWWGSRAVLACIAIGAALSAAVAPAGLVLASTAAFLISETMDWAVYTPLQRRRFLLAVAASNMVGLALDSAVFLYLAFGSLDFIGGNILGKIWMTVLALPILVVARRRWTTP